MPPGSRLSNGDSSTLVPRPVFPGIFNYLRYLILRDPVSVDVRCPCFWIDVEADIHGLGALYHYTPTLPKGLTPAVSVGTSMPLQWRMAYRETSCNIEIVGAGEETGGSIRGPPGTAYLPVTRKPNSPRFHE